jgi:hypothetical protein
LKTIALDFDGVMNTYSGWKGEDNLYEPRDGLSNFLEDLKDMEWRIVIYSTRDAGKIKSWLCKYQVNQYIDEVCFRKPIATCYLDDRAITFEGDFVSILEKLEGGFKAYWEPRCQ